MGITDNSIDMGHLKFVDFVSIYTSFIQQMQRLIQPVKQSLVCNEKINISSLNLFQMSFHSRQLSRGRWLQLKGLQHPVLLRNW
jgi:hypothetical protein